MMQRKSFLWQLFFRCFLVAVLTLAAVGLFASVSIRSFSRSQTASEMLSQARMIRFHVAEAVSGSGNLEDICTSVKESGSYVTIMTPDGDILCDSLGERVVAGAGFSEQPEINSALKLKEGWSVRKNEDTGSNFIYAALPVDDAGAVKAILRLAKPESLVSGMYLKLHTGLWLFIFAAFGISGLVSWIIIKRMVLPIEELTRGAMALASGDLTNRLHVPSINEMETLAESMNEMAAQLNERIVMVSSQRNELEAVLASMMEGVIAIDTDEQVISINHSAEQILGVPHEDVKGRKIHELTRNISLLKYVDAAIASEARKEEDIVLTRGGRRILNARSSPLMGITNERLGTLFVFNDVTKLRRLENMRRDFAANVSHEIKTPLTSIKGFFETLQTCIKEDPDRVDQFLEIIAKNISRLMAIIDDLLKLSRIENDNEQNAIRLSSEKIRNVIDAVVSQCSHKASSRSICIETVCPDDISVDMEASLMEQAVRNLLDNAIDYSNEGGSVVISASVKAGIARISVKDTGIGIPYTHLDRIFERFYRVDKARSRKAGGTGLGLAIVKHIMQAHGGNVEVSSRPGAGSTFILTFPASKREVKSDPESK